MRVSPFIDKPPGTLLRRVAERARARRVALRAGTPVADRPVGTLALDGGLPLFFYDQTFLADPLPLSPFNLPVTRQSVRHADRDFEFLPGVFADALPDG